MWKEAWYRYCDQQGNVRDPTKHDAGSLQNFLGMIGALPMPASLAPAQLAPGSATALGQLGPPPYQPAHHPTTMGQALAYTQAACWPPDDGHFERAARLEAPLGMAFPSGPQLGLRQAAPAGWMTGALPTIAPPAPLAGIPPVATMHGRGPLTGMPAVRPGSAGHGVGPGVGPMLGNLGGGRGGPGGRAPGGGGGNSSVHARLVQQVKHLQRSSEELKAVWHQACDAEKGGVRDPARHDVAFLQRFLQASEATAAAKSQGEAAFGIQMRPQSQMQQDPQQGALVAQVKRAQRAGLKDAWRQHCDAEAGGMRDPSRHTIASLRRFLETVDLPAETAPGSQGGMGATDMHLVEKVKCAQRSSPEWKDLWRKYCDAGGGGVYDPMRHENGFLQRFLSEHGINPEVPAGIGAGRMAGGPRPIGATSAPVSSTLEPLVQRVKLAQRASEELKKSWHHMCDAEGNGVRDPARHDAAFLLRFLEGVSPNVVGVPARELQGAVGGTAAGP